MKTWRVHESFGNKSVRFQRILNKTGGHRTILKESGRVIKKFKHDWKSLQRVLKNLKYGFNPEEFQTRLEESHKVHVRLKEPYISLEEYCE